MAQFHSSSSPAATVVITTKNRKEDLQKAIRSALSQSVPVEVLVIDDGSTDGTSEMVRSIFPEVILHRFEKSEGLIRQRNRGAALAGTNLIFSIDDDAEFSTPHVVEQTIRQFDHPRVGAVAIPFINVRQSPKVYQSAPDDQEIYVQAAYIGTAHALRRDVFLALKGYRAFLLHQGEEGDYCIRMLEAGFVARAGFSDPIHHFESPLRDMTRLHYYGTRNNVLFAWHNAPTLLLPWHILGTSLNNVRHAIKVRKLGLKLRALFAGYGCCLAQWKERQPVSGAAYRLFRQLKRAGPSKLREIEPLLPPMPGDLARRAEENLPLLR